MLLELNLQPFSDRLAAFCPSIGDFLVYDLWTQYPLGFNWNNVRDSLLRVWVWAVASGD